MPFIQRLQQFANTVATSRGVPLSTVDFNYALTAAAPRPVPTPVPFLPLPGGPPTSLPLSTSFPMAPVEPYQTGADNGMGCGYGGRCSPGVTFGTPNPSFPGTSMPAQNPYIDQIFNPLTGGPGGANPISAGDIGRAGSAAGGLCDLLPVAARAACRASVGVVTTVLGGAGDSRGASYNTMSSCPTGWVPDPTTGGCKQAGVSGMVSRMIPGGQTGIGWSATLGIYGSGVLPITVSSMTRKCPRGHVLGNDGVCYRRGAVTKQNRAWNPGTKPLLTGGDISALNKAKRLQKTIRRLNTSHGPKKACKCGIRKGKAVKV